MDVILAEHAQTLLDNVLGPLLPVLQDDSVQEVMVNGPDDVWIERHGQFHRLSLTLPSTRVGSIIRVLANLGHRDCAPETDSLLLDTRHDSWRVAAVLQPVAVRGHALCIRKHNPCRYRLDDLVVDHHDGPAAQSATVPATSSALAPRTSPLLSYLTAAIAGRKNLLISGGTSSGKTTLLDALMATLPMHQRLVVLEDTAELQIPVPNHVRFESSPRWGIDLRTLVRVALRFRPDRIVVGEVRGGEAFDLIQALSTGHPGSMATVHADDAASALARLEQLILQTGIAWPHDALCRQLARSIHVVVQMARTSGRRFISEVVEIDGFQEGRYIIRHIQPRRCGTC